MSIDQRKFDELFSRFVDDLGAAGFAAMVVIGDKLGLYKALAAGPATPAELARRTDTHQRYVAEWLRAQAASGYVTYDPRADPSRSARSRSSPWPTKTTRCTCPAPSRSPARWSRTNP